MPIAGSLTRRRVPVRAHVRAQAPTAASRLATM